MALAELLARWNTMLGGDRTTLTLSCCSPLSPWFARSCLRHFVMARGTAGTAGTAKHARPGRSHYYR